MTSRDPATLYSAHVETMDRRLADALDALGYDGLVVCAGSVEYPHRDDVGYPFRVEPHFASWLPLTDLPDAVLVLEPGGRRRLLYPVHDDFWHAPAGDPAGYWTEHFEIHPVRAPADRRAVLGALSGRYAAIGVLPEDCGAVAATNDRRLLDRLDYARAVKTGYEVACLERASATAVRGHAAVAAAYREPLSELELAQRFLTASGQREPELPYPSIVALNEHAAILHYQHLDRAAPAERLSFLIDAGAAYAGYAADVTRSYDAAGDGFGALIGSIDALQQTLCAELAAGTDFAGLDARAHELLAEVLTEHELVVCGAGEALDRGLTRVFLPHGLGHLLGLQVHDAGGRLVTPDGEMRPPPDEAPFLRLTRVVEPGFAVTIEPGIYFIAQLLDRLDPARRKLLNPKAIDKFLPYGGIRVEDDLIVESDGSQNLTRRALAALGAA
jgi:Xaa-Pro dipeptidase